jgi:hypothetical protein
MGAIICTIYEFSEGFKSQFRELFPLSLSWALSAWKAQRMTCRHNVYAVNGDSEKTTGLTYIYMSFYHVRNKKI